jgi:uncharacterized protein (DUF2235 family)
VAKHLVLCFDGTWNSADSGRGETNVFRLARAVRANSGAGGVAQLTLYMRGVGTTGSDLQRMLDGATGDGVDDNIRSGYMFLAQNYVPSDRIFLFGFSRGAFTARSLSGFLGACGLLYRQSLGDVAAAWRFYRTAPVRNREAFLEAHPGTRSHDVKVAFLGVWDTVGALGVPGTVLSALTAPKYRFHDTTPSRIVEVGRHALAIDEHRDEFEPTLWTGEVPGGCSIAQTWFAGAHSDVGGGYAERSLADIPLRWMADEAAQAGLALDEAMLPSTGALDPLAPQHESRLGWSRKDRLTPTIRVVAGKAPRVGVFERLARPRDEAGRLLVPINESIHPSVQARYGRSVTLRLRDEPEAETMTYRPKNLVPHYG